MKSLILTVIFLTSTAAYAHIDQGTWNGETSGDNLKCSMLVGNTTYLNNLKHPLNERIEITIDGQAFAVKHPTTLDFNSAVIDFNHDLFEGELATSTGATAVQIIMNHDPANKGPVSFNLINHNWKTNGTTRVICNSLKFNK